MWTMRFRVLLQSPLGYSNCHILQLLVEKINHGLSFVKVLPMTPNKLQLSILIVLAKTALTEPCRQCVVNRIDSVATLRNGVHCACEDCVASYAQLGLPLIAARRSHKM